MALLGVSLVIHRMGRKLRYIPFTFTKLTRHQQVVRTFLKVWAVDFDGGRNGKIEFFLTNESEQFWINSTSGTIYTSSSTNFMPGDIVLLDVKTRDLGSSSRG